MRLVKSVLERSVEMMQTLSAAPAGVSQLSATLDLPKSATHRLLQELLRLGWVEQDDDRCYRASLRFGLLGGRVLRRAGLPELAQPVLDRAARQTRELVRLTLAADRGLAWIGFAQGAPPGLMYAPEMTGPVVLHATANGKAYLATLTDAAALRLVAADLGRIRPTPHTLTTRTTFLAQLAAVRARGHALADEEAEPGVVALAIAIRPDSGPATGTVSVAGPKIRMSPARRPEFLAALVEAAHTLAALSPFRSNNEETGKTNHAR